MGINKFSNSERFANNIFYGIKPEHHYRTIHFLKNDPDLKRKENGFIKAQEIDDLKEFLDNKVPTIKLTRNRSADVNAGKFDDYWNEYYDVWYAATHGQK